MVDAFGIEDQLHRDEVMPERIGPPFGIAQDLVVLHTEVAVTDAAGRDYDLGKLTPEVRGLKFLEKLWKYAELFTDFK